MMVPVPDLILVGCVKTQLDHPAPAEELFTSPLFRYRREFAERSGRPWFILSSHHGLVAPETVIEPYDVPLARQPVAYRRRWAEQVVTDLVKATPDLAGMTLEIHAGGAHAEPVIAALDQRGAAAYWPQRGHNAGQHLAWYRHHFAGDR
jgi:hypothetical protein